MLNNNTAASFLLVLVEHPSQVSFNDVKSKSTGCVFGKWFSNLGAGISGLGIYLSVLQHECWHELYIRFRLIDSRYV